MTRPKLPPNLPTPTWQDKEYGIALYRGDCLDVMPRLMKVDHIITDPPYSERTHKGAKTSKDVGDTGKKQVFFNSFNTADMTEFVGLSLGILNRWLIFTFDQYFTSTLQDAFPCESIRIGVWVKNNPTPQFTGDRPAMGWEPICIMHNKGRKRWNNGGYPAVYRYPVVGSTEGGKHETQKPLALIQKLILDFTDPLETILDPFAGSGTTGVACVNLDRAFIGIEKEPKYFDIAVERISQAIIDKQDGPLFATHVPGQMEIDTDA